MLRQQTGWRASLAKVARRPRRHRGSLGSPSDTHPPAIVVGLDSTQGLQAARALASEGVPVIGLAKDPRHDCCRTRICEEIRYADTEDESLVDTLVALGMEAPQRPVLIPCEDANVLIVSRHRERLSRWFHIVLPPREAVELLMDKASFSEYAQAKGLPIPPTRLVQSRRDLEAAMTELRFPCILKPRNSATPEWEHESMFSAFKVDTAAELRELYDRYRSLTDVMILQDWIAGPDANHYTCNVYFDVAGRPVATFVSRKIRQWPPHIGTGSLSEECRNDEVRDATVSLLGALGYRGLGYVEFKRDADSGDYLIVEPNVGRPTGRSTIAEAGGVRMLYAMYCDALGWELPQPLAQRYQGAKWIFLRRDIQSALFYWRSGQLTLPDWARSWRGQKAYALFSLRDPGPFLTDLWRVIRLLFSGAERKRRDWRLDSAAD